MNEQLKITVTTEDGSKSISKLLKDSAGLIGAEGDPIGILATVLVVLFQNVLHRITFGNDSTGKNNFQAIVKNGASFVKDAEAFAEAQGGYLREVSVVHTQEITTYQMYIRTKEAIPSDVWQSFIAQHPYIIELQHTYVK